MLQTVICDLSWGQEELGRPFVNNYSYRDYGANPTNWWAVEDDKGIMYFANGEGVLQYDGANWRVIPAGNDSGSRSLARDENGTIYSGGLGELGYLAPNDKGQLEYISLKNKIPEEHRFFEDVWETDYWRGDIYFRTSDKIFRWDGQEMDVLYSKDNFHVGNIVHDEYYVRIWNRGLCKLEGDTFKVVPGGEQFADIRIYVMLPYDDERILIGTRNDGFFLYDGSTFTPFKTEADPFVEGDLYLPGIALDDGRFVLNTFANGVYIINREGELLQKITKENGLQDNSVDFTYLDSRGVLWLALYNGISSINLNSPFTYMGESMGLPSSIVFSLIRHNGLLYAGTNNGVYYFDEQSKEFLPIEGTFGQTYAFVQHKNRLYSASGGMGFFEIKGTSFEYVRKSINYDYQISLMLHSQTDPNRIYLDRRPGLSSLYFDSNINQFVEESNTDKVHPDFGGFEEDTQGNLWMDGTEAGTVVKLIPKFINGRLDLEQSEVITYDSTHGLPDGDLNFWKLNDRLEFFEDGDSYLFDEVRDTFVSTHLFYEEMQDPNALFYARPTKDAQGRTWFGPGKGVVVSAPSSEQTQEMVVDPFLELKNYPIWQIRIDEEQIDGETVAWFVGPEGIVRYQGDLSAPAIPAFNVNIRQMKIGSDSTLFAGDADPPQQVKLSSTDNVVTMSYASPFFIGESDLRYQTYLEGLDKEWSDWTTQTSREYINLPSGNYTFHVKASNLYGTESEEATFNFQIPAPWYNTWSAYFLYLLLFILLVYTIVQIRTNRLRKDQRKLEEMVKERTKEVQQRVDELATVNRVSQALTEKLDFDALVNLVGEQMKQLFAANISYLAILNEDTGIISFPYQDGDTMEPIKYGQGLTSQVIQSGEPLLINHDISREYDQLGIERVGKNAASYLGVPIPVENKVIGVLSVQSTETENRFDENDKRLLTTIARNVGIALHNAELYEAAKIAKAQAEDANEAKSSFLSTVSHELRTPLTSVLGFAKIIRKRLEDKIFPAVQIDDQKIKRTMKQVSDNLAVVVSEGERLTNLINDVLDLAKIESGKMDWNMQPIFIQDVISRALASTNSLFEEKGLTMVSNVPEQLPVLNGDQDKLIQVVINLLSNAVKFTDKGKITVDAYEDKGQIIVEIQDTGIGIADEDKSKVFEKFRQAGDTLTDKPKGTGLGLPICREIIEYHGGIIWMKSELGVGSTFFFSLPILGEASGAHPLPLEKIVRSLKKQIEHSTLKTTKDTATILVVDDDTPIRSLLRQELSDAGYIVKEAGNGKAALDLVRVTKPDLIILDVMMPEINGFDVAAVLKNDPDTMDIPIIILSIVEDQERGFKIGVDRYLTKPIDTEKLFTEVDALLEQGVSKKKVLVVDEDVSTVKTLSSVLQQRGYKVLESQGGDLLETALRTKPDIIMLNSGFDNDQTLVKTLKFEKGMEHVLFLMYQ